ncbi:hypothetical protein CSUI_009500 [Cystoisospora suis]|uniref:Uncharacterized protein n=1 Tax=Cystoisospora suis TaxID=483139 RepID=A0A2C6KJW3_9APIC|nr:hypothetical protein CSUI_009500 [Cystoisospora suis]
MSVKEKEEIERPRYIWSVHTPSTTEIRIDLSHLKCTRYSCLFGVFSLTRRNENSPNGWRADCASRFR